MVRYILNKSGIDHMRVKIEDGDKMEDTLVPVIFIELNETLYRDT